MKTFIIHGQAFELDENKKYMDFFLTDGVPNLVLVDFGAAFEHLVAGRFKLEDVAAELVLLDRWIEEGPRKRFYRELKLAGVRVHSEEHFFEHRRDGEEIIDALENSGRVARRFLETFAPETAQRCKDGPHPARSCMIDPS